MEVRAAVAHKAGEPLSHWGWRHVPDAEGDQRANTGWGGEEGEGLCRRFDKTRAAARM